MSRLEFRYWESEFPAALFLRLFQEKCFAFKSPAIITLFGVFSRAAMSATCRVFERRLYTATNLNLVFPSFSSIIVFLREFVDTVI